MDDQFAKLAHGGELTHRQATELDQNGFVVLPQVIPAGSMTKLIRAYDREVAAADEHDVRQGSTTTRVTDFVNRGAAFDSLYILPPLLEACCRIIAKPFKLSSMHSRTVRPGAEAQQLHVDVEPDTPDWPLAGFILMVNDFTADNGATAFVSGSHRSTDGLKVEITSGPAMDPAQKVLACGPAGSMIVFNGSVWHGHTINASPAPRRSIQGAFIPRDGPAGTDFAARMLPETRSRLSPLAHYLLGL